MGQEDGRYAALAAAPYARRDGDLPRTLDATAWRELVVGALQESHAWGPGVEPTDALDALADAPPDPAAPPHAVTTRADAVVVLAGVLHACDAWIWTPSAPLSDLLARDRFVSRATFADLPAPDAAWSAWRALCRTMRDDGPRPWWLDASLGRGWDLGVTSPDALRGLVSSLAQTGVVAAVARATDAMYGPDLEDLSAWLARAAADGRWLFGTAAGS